MAMVSSSDTLRRAESGCLPPDSDLPARLIKFYETMDVKFGLNGQVRVVAQRRSKPNRHQISAARMMVDLTIEEVCSALDADLEQIQTLELTANCADDSLLPRLVTFYEGMGVRFNRQGYNCLLR